MKSCASLGRPPLRLPGGAIATRQPGYRACLKTGVGLVVRSGLGKTECERVVEKTFCKRSPFKPRLEHAEPGGRRRIESRHRTAYLEGARAEAPPGSLFQAEPRDPHFIEKLHDVVGLYLNPPEHALVFSVDEKSQIQALDRTQPGLPMKRGRAETVTHDYKRNGTTTLFAALNTLDGKVIGQCLPRHRHQEFLRFLRTVHRQTPKGLDLHLILDNYATHNHPAMKEWLAKHPRFFFHFVPTSLSWLNMVERWLNQITQKRIRRGVFPSVPDLIAAITEYIELTNDNPKPFVWTATVETIIAKVKRANEALDAPH